MTALCAASRHDGGEEPPEAEQYATLCAPCRRGLSRDLRRLPGYHADLEHILVTLRQGSQGGGDGLPVNEPVSDCRSQIRHDLAYWARHVTAERGLDAPPVLDSGDWARNPVAVMCGWLAGQVTWLVFRDWAADMAGAIGADAGRAAALLDPWVTKRFPVPGRDGICLACGAGRIQVTIYSEGDRRRSFMACDGCEQRWEPEQWLHYGRQVIRRREAIVG